MDERERARELAKMREHIRKVVLQELPRAGEDEKRVSERIQRQSRAMAAPALAD
jgi:hypothetical protein